MLLKIIVVTLVAFDLSSYKYQHVRNERDGKLCCLNKYTTKLHVINV